MAEDGYRLISFRSASGVPQAGVKVGDRVYPAASLMRGLKDAGSVLGLLREWDKAHPLLEAAAKNVDPKGGAAMSDVSLLAPILYPGALLLRRRELLGPSRGDGRDRQAHHRQGAGDDQRAKDPWFFMKTTAGSIIGHNTPARLPKFSKQVDWEAELGVVIARPTRNISEERRRWMRLPAI